MEISDSHSYLGMQLILKPGTVIIDMVISMETLLMNCSEEALRAFTTPSGKDIFSVDENSEILLDTDRKQFHTNIAKLLYLSKRARPDILTAIGFLCTRVTWAIAQ